MLKSMNHQQTFHSQEIPHLKTFDLLVSTAYKAQKAQPKPIHFQANPLLTLAKYNDKPPIPIKKTHG